jgi:hypothetical protein
MTVRNNEERTGARFKPDPPPTPDTPTQTNEPAGLRFVVPTEAVELPSRGDFYPEGHPLHNQDTLEIRHMTAKEEDILTSRTLLKKGTAIDKLLQSVIADKKVNVDDLLVGDKNALIVATRIAAYGADYATRVTCPACSESNDYSFDLDDSKVIYPDSENSEFEFEQTDNNTFKVTLPKTGFVVELRLLTGRDEKWLTKAMEQKRKNKMSETTLTDQIRLFTVSVNGVTDKLTLNEFVNTLPATDSRYLRNAYKTLTPNLDLRQEFSCPECGTDTTMEVPFTADFFWPKS